MQIGFGNNGSIVSDIRNNGIVKFNRFFDDYAYQGNISGTVSVVQSGPNTLVFTGDHTYAGGTTISGGSALQIGNGGTHGSLSSSGGVTINSFGKLIFNRSDTSSYGGVIRGAGSLLKDGAGTLVLTGSNSHSGGTTVAAGTLQTSGSGRLTGAVTVLNSAALQLAANVANNLSTLTVLGGTADIRGASFTATTVTLSGGSVTISNGVSVIPVFNLYAGTATANSALSITSGLVMGGGGAGTTAVLNVAASRTTSLMGNLTFTAVNDSAIDSAGAFIGGEGRLSFVGTRTLAINDSANADYDLTISATIGGGSFVKTGEGTLYLAGTNFSATTNTLAAGRLVIGNDRALGTGALVVTGGSLSGDGTARTVTNSLILRSNLVIGGNSDLTFGSSGTNGVVTVSGGNRTLTVNNTGVTRIQSLQIGESSANRTLTLAGTGRLVADVISQGSLTGGGNLVVQGPVCR